jgi:hypothetical protein
MTNEETTIDEPTSENKSAMEDLLADNDMTDLSRVVSGVLEFLTVRASVDGPYYILADGGVAVTVFGANDDVQRIIEALPDHVRAWEDLDAAEDVDFLTDTDPGDEQADDTE